MSSLEPISVTLVTAGSRGEKLLFRYPFREDKYVNVTGKSLRSRCQIGICMVKKTTCSEMVK